MDNLFSLEHEMSAIGSALLSVEAARDLLKILKPRHFFRASHQTIWEAIGASFQAGQPCEVELMIADLKRKKRLGSSISQLEECGGELTLLEIAQFVPSPANALYYAQVVLDFARRRSYVELGKQAEGGLELTEIETKALAIAQEADVTAVHEGFTAGTIGSGKVKIGISTGFGQLDQMIVGGGWVRGQQSTVAARQKGGKSAFMIQSALHAADLGFNVVYATFADLSAANVEERCMKQLTGYSHEPMNPGDAESWHERRTFLRSLGITVYEPRKMGFSKDLETFERWLRGKHKQRKVDLILLDYAQKLWMRVIPRHETYRQAEGCSDFIDDMAREFSAAFVVGSQITLSGDGGQEMTKGSRVWEENTAFLVKPKILSEDDARKVEAPFRLAGISRLDVPLNRFGPAGSAWATWSTSRVRYEEVA